MQKIAVIGATGMLGLPVVEELVNAGFQVTALVRDPQSAMQRLPADVRIVQADVRDIESLKAGLSGQDAVYLNLSIAPSAREGDFHTEKEGLDNIIAASRGAGIKRIAYLSAMIEQLNPDRWWGIDIWRKAIARIKASGISYTIFYATNFMERRCRKSTCAGTRFRWWERRNIPTTGLRRATMRCRSPDRSGWPGPRTANTSCKVPCRSPMTRLPSGLREASGGDSSSSEFRFPFSSGSARSPRQANFSANILEAVLAYPEKFKAHRTWKELGRPATTVGGIRERAQGLSFTLLCVASIPRSPSASEPMRCHPWPCRAPSTSCGL